MKRFLILSWLVLIASPVFAVCDITTGLCRSDIAPLDSLNERLVPNNLNDLQNPVTLNINSAPSDIRYNLAPPVNNNVNSEPYDASCQFGACIGRPPINTNEF